MDIQAALDAVPVEGGYVLVPAGIYVIGSPLRVKSGTRLEVHGTIRLAPGANCHLLKNVDDVGGNDDITVIGGTWDGSKATQNGDGTKYGLWFKRVRGLTVHGVHVINVDGDGLRISGLGGGASTRPSRVTNVLAEGCKTGMYVCCSNREATYDNIHSRLSTGDGIVFDHSELIASNIWSQESGERGIFFRNMWGATLSNIVASRNKKQGVYVQGLVASLGTNWRLQNNGDAKNNTWDDLYFSEDASQSYGLTRNTAIVGLMVGGHSPPVRERYGIYFEDGMSASNIQLSAVTYLSTLTGPVRMPPVVTLLKVCGACP